MKGIISRISKAETNIDYNELARITRERQISDAHVLDIFLEKYHTREEVIRLLDSMTGMDLE